MATTNFDKKYKKYAGKEILCVGRYGTHSLGVVVGMSFNSGITIQVLPTEDDKGFYPYCLNREYFLKKNKEKYSIYSNIHLFTHELYANEFQTVVKMIDRGIFKVLATPVIKQNSNIDLVRGGRQTTCAFSS